MAIVENEDHLKGHLEGSTSDEGYLRVLKLTDNKQKLYFDRFHYPSHYLREINSFSKKIKETNDGLAKLTVLYQLLTNSAFLRKLNSIGTYKYCQQIDGRYQSFEINLENRISSLKEFIAYVETGQKYLTNQKLNHDSIDKERGYQAALERGEDSLIRVSEGLVTHYVEKLMLWNSAYSIGLAYKACLNDPDITFFSHRLAGWSSPVVQINEKLAIEFKTNFGYGRSSYFFIKLNYKGIDLIPFEDLILYEHAGFVEIATHTKRYQLENESWDKAFKFAAYSLNLISTNEAEFINKFLVQQLDKMVEKLSSLVEGGKNTFKFKKDFYRLDEEQGYSITFDADDIIEFRARKISNALQFTTAITQCKEVISINSHIGAIERFNKTIQPIIKKEVTRLESKVAELDIEILKQSPRVLELNTRRQQIVNDYKSNHLEDPDKKFENEHPELSATLKSRIEGLNQLKDTKSHCFQNLKKLNVYFEQIQDYFKLKVVSS